MLYCYSLFCFIVLFLAHLETLIFFWRLWGKERRKGRGRKARGEKGRQARGVGEEKGNGTEKTSGRDIEEERERGGRDWRSLEGKEKGN